MTVARAHVLLVTGFLLAICATTASAEPKFLSKQYPRCTSCHYSPTGGGLLTAYGRSLSHRELSTFGEPMPAHDDTTRPDTMNPEPGEESFLWGAFGKSLGNLHLGIETRPSYLHYSFLDFSDDRNLLMNADLHAAYRYKDWTFYGQVGRELQNDGRFSLDSSEYWIGRQPEEGFGFRAGRFLPAYGIRFADHTSYNRQFIGLTQYDQILGVELSHSRGRYLTQVSIRAWTGRDGLRRGRRRGVHRDRSLSDRSHATHGGRGVGAFPRWHRFRSATGIDRRRLRLRADVARHDVDAVRRAIHRRSGRDVVRLRQRDVVRGLSRDLGCRVAAGTLWWRRTAT